MKKTIAFAALAFSLAGCSVFKCSKPRPVCIGDCDGNGVVTAEEIEKVRSITAGEQLVSACVVADANADGMVTVDELTKTTVNASQGCP